MHYYMCLLLVHPVHPLDNACLFSHLLQALTIIAFNGKLNKDTFKLILSIGPTFTIMNFIESKLFHTFMIIS